MEKLKLNWTAQNQFSAVKKLVVASLTTTYGWWIVQG
jgi:hypothetical protein